jgi:hypothetical protein
MRGGFLCSFFDKKNELLFYKKPKVETEIPERGDSFNGAIIMAAIVLRISFWFV